MLSCHTFPMDCLICFKHHALSSCPIFRTYNVKQRSYTVRVHRYCSNCFSRSHTAMACSSIGRCLKCGEPHHTMLHPDNIEPTKKTGNILPAQQCSVKDPLTVSRKTITPLNGVGHNASQPRQNKPHKQRSRKSCSDDLTSVSLNEDDDFQAEDDIKVEQEKLESNDDSEQSDSGCNKTEDDEFEDDNNLERDKSGRYKHKGCCYLCRRESKFKRKTRQICGTCMKPICLKHSLQQTKCKECHMGAFKADTLFASNSDDKQFNADDVEERDASGRLLHKGRCSMCYEEMKRRRLTRRSCSTCKKPVCAQHYNIQIKCGDCYAAPSKTSEIS